MSNSISSVARINVPVSGVVQTKAVSRTSKKQEREVEAVRVDKVDKETKKSLESQQRLVRGLVHNGYQGTSVGSEERGSEPESRLLGGMMGEYKGEGKEGTAHPEEYVCPIGMELMRDPVSTPSGISYEREAIESWIEIRGTDPHTREALRVDDLTPNIGLKNAINRYLQQPKIWEIIEELEAEKRKVARQDAEIEELRRRAVFYEDLRRLYEDQRKETAALISSYENKITGLSAGQEKIAASEAAAEAESKAEVRGAKERVNQARILLGKRFIGREELERWGIPIRGEVPELPEALANSLEEMCPITGEGQVKDTHILVLNPGLSIQEWQGIIDGKNHRSEHKGEKFYYPESEAWYKDETFYKAGVEVGWRLILAKPQPGSLDKRYPEMDAMELAAGYTGAGVNDIIVGACSYYLNSGEKLFQYANKQGVMSTAYTDSRNGIYVRFGDDGLRLGYWNGNYPTCRIGRGVLRK